MGRRRKRFKALRLKKQTIYTVFALGLNLLALLISLSFFQNGTALDQIKSVIFELFGWGALLLPILLISFSLLFIPVKSSLTSANVFFGMVLSYVCILAISQSGIVGITVWQNFSALVSPIGAFFILFFIFLTGLIVIFNLSLDDLIVGLSSVLKEFRKYSQSLSAKKSKPLFVEKLTIKSTDLNKDEPPHTPGKPTPGIKTQKLAGDSLNLGNSMITNPTLQNTIWEYPPLSLLETSQGQTADRGDMKQQAQTIEKTLDSFGITARVSEVNLGPAVTQYALEIALGTKVSKITSLANDLALALAAPTGQIRIEAPIPGRRLVGIEIPNRSLEFVTLRHLLSSDSMKKNSRDKLLVALGLDVSGRPIFTNISKMPHVLIAGTTGSGKSVLINTWISSLLFRTTPSEVRVILVDPKRVELTGYNGIPHLLTPVIVEPDKILSALKWAITEMERRYKMFAEVGVRNIDGYNELSGFQAIPYIIIFIDELADLMAYAPVEVEDSICRIAQMARATGIHLVLATQRPSVDVLTGLIKANIPTRIAFNVSSMIDSRVIIDMPGAEKLLGRGDMLYIPPDQAKPTRIQGTYISEREVSRLVEFLKAKNVPVEYTEEVVTMPQTWKKTGAGTQIAEDGKDPLFREAVRVVCQYDRASASLLQRRLSIGYARAARIIDQLESESIIGAGEGAKPRDVLVKNPDEYFANQNTSQLTQ